MYTYKKSNFNFPEPARWLFISFSLAFFINYYTQLSFQLSTTILMTGLLFFSYSVGRKLRQILKLDPTTQHISSVLIIILILVNINPVYAKSLNTVGWVDMPVFDGIKITDHQGFDYYSQSDGLYRVVYNGKTTYFGFGVTGTYNGGSIAKLSTDYTWNKQLTTLANGYSFTSTTTGGEWTTNFKFTTLDTKITNTLKNIYSQDITNAKFYYLLSLNYLDSVQYDGQTYVVPANPNIHITGNLNSKIPRIIINGDAVFNFKDLIDNGFTITDFYVVPASSLGFSSAYNIMAIGFIKGDGIIKPGAIVMVDPSLEQDGGSVTLYGNVSYDYVNLTNGAILYVAAYNGTAGTGTLNLTVNYTLTVDATSSIKGIGRGYLGGQTGRSPGSGSGAGGWGVHSVTNGGGGGGGSGYGTVGGAGGTASAGNGYGAGGSGGPTYGTTTDTEINMGSGAGASGYEPSPNVGGAGGAMLNITANTVNIYGTMSFNGGVGGTDGSYGFGAGGGASGGGIKISAVTVNISGATITLAGGSGGTGYYGATNGGAGGGGRFKVFYSGTFSNTSTTLTTGTAYYKNTNNVPTVPTITNPTNNSIGYNEITVNMTWETSTDADGDPISYNYQVSNNSIFTDLLYDTYTTNTYSGAVWIPANSQMFFRVKSNDTYNSSAWSPVVSIRDLTLSSPANQSQIYHNYPPLISSVTFAWSATNSSVVHHNLIIARDANFNLIESDTTFQGLSKTLSLSAGSFWWKVRPYYTGTGTYGLYTPAWNFTLTANYTAGSGTAIHGTIYELLDGVQTPLSGVTVNIQHSAGNWSSGMTTGTNGYYLFTGLSNDTTYYIYATKKDYQNSATEYVTTVGGTWVTRNIFMKPTEPTWFEADTHYVKFKARWLYCIWDCDIAGATIDAYNYGEVVAYKTAITDSTGSVSFLLFKTQRYRVTVTHATAGISQEMTIYPKDTEYIFLIKNTDTPWTEPPVQEKDAINISLSKATLNSTHATITVNYTDALSDTTNLTIYVNQSNGTSTENVIASWNNAGAGNHTFTISNYSGQQYKVHIIAAHTTYGTIDRTYAVLFEKSAVGIQTIPATLWLWFAIGMMFFVAAMFTGSTAEIGAVLVCAIGWIFFSLGMFSSLNTIQFGIALTVATIISVMAYIRKSQDRGGYT